MLQQGNAAGEGIGFINRFFIRRIEISAKIEDWAMSRESLREELDAINRYEERIAQTSNVSLKKVLQHNADEEKEHVAMLVEWLRQNDRTQDKVFKEHD